MNAVIALCHFCELHGPSVLFCTQTYHESDDPERVLEKRPKSTNEVKKFYGRPEKYFNRSTSNCENQNEDTNTKNTSGKSTELCIACQSFLPGQPDFICNDHEAKVSYISSQYPHHPEVFTLVRQACVRSLSCEICPGREGPIFFGDEHRSHVFSHTFFLKDSQARGFQRWFSIVVVMMDKIFLLNSWPFLVKHVRNVIDELQEKANRIYNVEQIDCPQRALRLNSSFSMTPANFRRQRGNLSVRGLSELTNDKEIFADLHLWFTWILKAGGNRLTEKLLEGPPTEDTVIDLEKSVETEEGFMLVNTKKIPKEYSREIENQAKLETNEQPPTILTLRGLFQILGKEKFHELAYHVITGNQIIIRCSQPAIVESIIQCLKVLIPRGCFHPIKYSQEYQDSYKCNFLGIPSTVEIPPHVKSSHLHILLEVIPPSESFHDIHQCQFILSSCAELPEKSPFLLNRFESAIQDNNLSDKVLDCLFTSLKEEWTNKAKVLFKFSRTASRSVEDTQKLLHVLGAQDHDKLMLKFWMTGLSAQFKTHVLSATTCQCFGNEGAS